MIIEAYGIKLVRLKEEYLELVRYWRNYPKIRRYMEFRDYITPLMQKNWFNSINNKANNYFVIFIDEIAIGLISGTQIDWEEGVTHNGGIFIWDIKYYESYYPAKAAVLLTDLSFWLGLKKTYIKILNDNQKSIGFNKLLGYALKEGQEGAYNQEYELTQERYFSSVEKIRKTIGAEGKANVIVKQSEMASYTHMFERMSAENNSFKSNFNIIVN